ncbi:hypothetical protein [Macrococcus animalis]|uniref:hypothetical protein n=1 Tax=Macrococcus animalis TaxID=3395467 RepID=UPI0039BEB17F
MTNNINKGDYVLIDNTDVEGEVNKIETRDSGTYVILKGGVTAFPIEDAYVITKHVEEESQKEFKEYNAQIPRSLDVNDVFLPYSHEEIKVHHEEETQPLEVHFEDEEDHELADEELGHRMAIEPKERYETDPYETDPGDEVEDTEPSTDDVQNDVESIIDKAIEELNELKAKLNA